MSEVVPPLCHTKRCNNLVVISEDTIMEVALVTIYADESVSFTLLPIINSFGSLVCLAVGCVAESVKNKSPCTYVPNYNTIQLHIRDPLLYLNAFK